MFWISIPSLAFLIWQYQYFGKRNSAVVIEKTNCQAFSIGFYNLENLFDTIDDPKTMDEEFLPSSINSWNTARYQHKLDNMAEVIAALNNNAGLDIIGVCEIENRLVLDDLLKRDKLKKFNYGIVHYDSPDARGIDVALFYKTDQFKVIASRPLKVDFNEENFATRDILWATLLKGKDTLHVFVNHWPSRRGGTETSEAKRIAAAQTLKTFVSALCKNPDAHIVLIGDFNDEPENKSIKDVLGTYDKPQQGCSTCLVNPMEELHRKKLGTHYYRGKYNMFDQIIFTSNLSRPEFDTMNYNAVRIFKADWVMKTDSLKKSKYPSRTFEGPRYNGGYSDHLAVFTTLCLPH